MFNQIDFIKPNRKYEKGFTGRNYAPMFRKKFTIESTDDAFLYVCGLGIAHYFINGVKVSADLFTAPVSDYNKTLWYNTYKVSDYLKKGENIIAVWCGNGWYNEDFKT